jgi:hypothetical protein
MNKRHAQAVLELAVVLGLFALLAFGSGGARAFRWSPCSSRSWCIAGSARRGMLATTPRMVQTSHCCQDESNPQLRPQFVKHVTVLCVFRP